MPYKNNLDYSIMKDELERLVAIGYSFKPACLQQTPVGINFQQHKITYRDLILYGRTARPIILIPPKE